MGVQDRLMQWNLNTILVAVGFAATFVGWGVTWGDTQSTLDSLGERLTSIETRVGSVEATTRTLDNHELRIVAVERRTSDASASLRSLEKTLSELAADMRVTREILSRIEAKQEKL